mgnify:CR=1 FL=1
MKFFCLAAVLLLLLLIGVGLRRVLAGPTAADRLLAVQLFGTLGAAIVLLLGRVQGDRAFTDLALTFAMLAAVFSIAFARHAEELLEPGPEASEGDNDHP